MSLGKKLRNLLKNNKNKLHKKYKRNHLDLLRNKVMSNQKVMNLLAIAERKREIKTVPKANPKAKKTRTKIVSVKEIETKIKIEKAGIKRLRNNQEVEKIGIGKTGRRRKVRRKAVREADREEKIRIEGEEEAIEFMIMIYK